ncbi:MAG: sensor histidine kinase [Candidatus Dormibacteria bacterium]
MLLGLVCLVAIGLAAIDAVTYLTLQGSLIQQVDSQLSSSSTSVYSCLLHELETSSYRCFGVYVPVGSFAELVHAGGGAYGPTYFGHAAPAPRIPARLLARAASGPVERTVAAVSGSSSYQVWAAPVTPPGLQPSILVFAEPLSGVEATLGQLRLLEILVSTVIMAVLGVGAWWTVQLGLSPLRRIRDTAQKIAAGDLTQRIASTDPRTEVGELGVSLNEMLSQIEQAFEARMASEDRLRQFVADASHELRTPLSSIRGYAELFRRGASANPEDLGTAMQRIESESIRMAKLVDDLLLLARLDEGRPLEMRPVDLSRIAVDCAADQSAADRHHPIATSAASPVVVVGDESRLRQVVTNLVRNAVVHTPDQTRVEISVGERADHGFVEVADHGPGIPTESQERIFERFVRIDKSRGRARGGAGLGLAIVAAIVAAHHGRIRHLPTPGGGATFRVELPKTQATWRQHPEERGGAAVAAGRATPIDPLQVPR